MKKVIVIITAVISLLFIYHSNIVNADELIKLIQQALTDKSYDPGVVDGIMGNKTRLAIKAFQRDTNVTIDGTISSEVLKRLNIQTVESAEQLFTEQKWIDALRIYEIIFL